MNEIEWESGFCEKCGAWYGQLGLEPTLDMYLDHLLSITAELRRVLKPTGVMFWNHGDCYGGSGCGKGDYRNNNKRSISKPNLYCDKPSPQLKLTPKCMAMQNYRLIQRMVDEQDWTLRNIVIWHKPNAMPSSVKDRFVVSYEPIFMLVKERKYWFDQDAIRKPYDKPLDRYRDRDMRPNKEGRNPRDVWGLRNYKRERKGRKKRGVSGTYPMPTGSDHNLWNNPKGRNPRDVWRLPTRPKPFKGIHFAVFPEDLVRPMIKVACPPEICKKCGKARERITEGKSTVAFNVGARDTKKGRFKEKWGKTQRTRPHYEKYEGDKAFAGKGIRTVGWTDCGCGAGWRPGVILDPFIGSGTVAVVANKLNRDWLGIEISPKFVKLAEKRIRENPKPMV